jgi:asparagine synthase (glutamine-hydrolysing)
MPRASPKLASLLEYGGSIPGAYLLRRGLFMPWELGEFLPPDTLREGLATFDALEHIAARSAPDARSAFACVASLEAALYMRNQLLRDADWASMAWSLEVRVPLVDRTLLERVAPLLVAPGATSRKGLLARAPLPGLPADVVARPKTGFTTPIAAWLEQSSDLGRWRDRPSLRRDGCHWSRRFAYDLLRINGAAV